MLESLKRVGGSSRGYSRVPRPLRCSRHCRTRSFPRLLLLVSCIRNRRSDSFVTNINRRRSHRYARVVDLNVPLKHTSTKLEGILRRQFRRDKSRRFRQWFQYSNRFVSVTGATQSFERVARLQRWFRPAHRIAMIDISAGGWARVLEISQCRISESSCTVVSQNETKTDFVILR